MKKKRNKILSGIFGGLFLVVIILIGVNTDFSVTRYGFTLLYGCIFWTSLYRGYFMNKNIQRETRQAVLFIALTTLFGCLSIYSIPYAFATSGIGWLWTVLFLICMLVNAVVFRRLKK